MTFIAMRFAHFALNLIGTSTRTINVPQQSEIGIADMEETSVRRFEVEATP